MRGEGPWPGGEEVARRHLFGLLIALVSGCRRGGERAARGAGRVVSLSPATTEAVFAVGAGALMVGRSRYCDYPDSVKSLPSVGGVTDPSFEAILSLSPTLVVGAEASARSMAERLSARGIEGYFPPTESMAQIDAMIEGVGQRTGHAEGGREAAAKAREARERVARAVSGRPRPRVLMVFGLSPIFVAGPGCFADEMLRLAGGVNAVERGAASTPYPQLGLEQVLALDPDVVLDAAKLERHGGEGLGPNWQKLRAVREGRVVTLSGEAVLRPGPRVAEGAAEIARGLHPGVLP